MILTGSMVLSMPQVVFAVHVEESTTDLPIETSTSEDTISETESMETKVTEETESISTTESETKGTGQTESHRDTEETTETEEETNLEEDKPDPNVKNPENGLKEEDHSDANADLTSNIIAGNGVYLEQLQSTYKLKFEDEFETIMDEIEEDYKEWLNEPEEFLATNWQQVLAVYVLQYRQEDEDGIIVMNKDSKLELEKIFFLMNIRSSSAMANKLSVEVDRTQETYAMTIEDYGELRNLDSDAEEILKEYTSDNCKLLCAMITAAKGFVREEVGEGVSEERIAVVAAACSLIGKVGYFWGGKSYAVKWDNLWGNPMAITAAGSRSTGTTRGYGLDCSGFVSWSYYNGLSGSDGGVGSHTTSQWNASSMVENADAKPGDMVFYNSPVAGDQNHVGLVIGKNTDGSLMVVHCSSSKNGVVVGEAWSSGFKYVRKPISLP